MTLSPAIVARMLDEIADCIRDYDLSVKGAEQLLRTTANVVRKNPPTPEHFGRLFMECVRAVRIEKKGV